jgi:hypothetical protein
MCKLISWYLEASLSSYSIFVNGRGRPEIMENMRSRIARGNIMLERQEAIKVNFHFILCNQKMTQLIRIFHRP